MDTQDLRRTGWMETLVAGPGGKLLVRVLGNGRCPARDFLDGMPTHLRKRFRRTFRTFTEKGMDIAANGLFKPLDGPGNLWSFKQHDHRLYATRGPNTLAGAPVLLLLHGWVKDKDGRAGSGREESREIGKARAAVEQYIWSWALLDPSVKPAPLEPPSFTPRPARRVLETRPVTARSPGPTPASILDQAVTYITIKDLAEATGESPAVLRGLLKRRRLPGSKVLDPRGTHGWPAGLKDDLVRRISEWKGKAERRWRGLDPEVYRKAEGVYACPRCGREFERGLQVHGHLSHCKRVAAPAVPVEPAVVEATDTPVMSEKELKRMAEHVIAGKARPEEFAQAVEVRNQRVRNLEQELRRLKGPRKGGRR